MIGVLPKHLDHMEPNVCVVCIYLGCCAMKDIHPKLIFNSNLAKSRSSITSVSVIQSIWNFAQSTAVILPCSVQYFKTIGLLTGMFRTNGISRDLSLRWVSGGWPILQSTPIHSGWHHDIEMLSALLALWEGNLPVTDGPSLHKRPVMGSFDVVRVSMLLDCTSCWANSRVACRWFEAPWHSCDVTVMLQDDLCNPMRYEGRVSQSLSFGSVVLIYNRSKLIQLIAWYRASGEPLTVPTPSTVAPHVLFNYFISGIYMLWPIFDTTKD